MHKPEKKVISANWNQNNGETNQDETNSWNFVTQICKEFTILFLTIYCVTIDTQYKMSKNLGFWKGVLIYFFNLSNCESHNFAS
jgi:hypothetical protein